MSDTRGPVLGLDVGGQLGLELEHGAALLSLTLEVRQLVQGLVRVHPLEVASVKIKNINAAPLLYLGPRLGFSRAVIMLHILNYKES